MRVRCVTPGLFNPRVGPARPETGLRLRTLANIGNLP